MTEIYYKESADEEGVIKKHKIDGLFLTKIDLATNVPKEDEAGIRDNSRDLSNYFELYDPESNLRSSDILKEASNIFVGDSEGSKIEMFYDVIGENGEGEVIGRANVQGNESWYEFDIPARFRGRVCFYNFYFVDVKGSSGGGFTTPEQTTVRGWACSTPELRFTFEMQMHEVEVIDTAIHANDIVNKYAAPNKDIPWWQIVAFSRGKKLSVDLYAANAWEIEAAPIYSCIYKYFWGQYGDQHHYGGIIEKTKPFGDTSYRGTGQIKYEGRAMIGIVGPWKEPEPEPEPDPPPKP